MNVLHILWSADFGGIQRLVFDLTFSQSRTSDMKASVLFCKKSGEFLKIFEEAGLTCYFLNLKSGYVWSFSKYLKAINIFKNFDIIHFHSFNPFISLCALISKSRIVYTEHGVFGFGRKKTWTDYFKHICKKAFLNSHVDIITFNSNFTKKIAERRYGLLNVKRTVVYNGRLYNKKQKSSYNIEKSILNQIQGKFVVGTTSRFAGFKRIDRLIQAFSLFNQDKDAILLLVGDGVLRNELKQLVNKSGLSENTIFTGYRDNVIEFQQLMDVCVFPSENEPFGLVALETLYLGKPTIVFKDGGGITEIIGGFSEKDVIENIPHLVERINYYYDNRNEITDYSQLRTRYALKFDIANMADQFLNIYKELINAR